MIPAREPEVDAAIQHYRLERQIGAGGMGAVWAARDTRSGEACALKILRPSAGDADVARARLLREAHAARSIRHPAIVPVIDVLEHEGNPVLVMELLHGETLRERLLREERLSAEGAAALLLPIAEVLSAA